MTENSTPSPIVAAVPAAAPLLPKSDKNLVWLDCEMTGLEPETDRLIEIAVIVTNADLSVRIEGPVFVIHQTDETLDKMDAWNKGTHGKSGLIDKVRASTVAESDAEKQLIEFLLKYTPKNSTPMCGNTISQDSVFWCAICPSWKRFSTTATWM